MYRASVAAVVMLLAGSLATGAATAANGPVPSPWTPGLAPSSCSRIADGYRCTFGPVDVAPGEMKNLLTGMAAPSEAGYITSLRATLVDSDGRPIPQSKVMLHHAVWLNPLAKDTTCDSFDGNLPNWERFFASGKERTKAGLPSGYGYLWAPPAPQPVTQSTPFWGLNLDLMGMDGFDDVNLALKIGFTPLADAGPMKEVTPVWLDVRNCSTYPVFDVAKGSGRNGKVRVTWNYRMPVDGRFVFLGGHLHDGGLKLSLFDGDRELFTSRAVYGMSGHMDMPDHRMDMQMSGMSPPGWNLTGMTSWRGAPGIVVSKGDHLRLVAVYDSTHNWPEVMGIMLGALAER